MNVTANAYPLWVTLSDVPDGTAVTYSPSRVKCSIEPLGPSQFDERAVSHNVRMRYNAQISFQTQLTFTDRNSAVHRLFVKGINNVGMRNRELVLLCDEVMTPA